MDYEYKELKEKPPLGLKPKWLHQEHRLLELIGAMERRLTAGKDIPNEWTSEFNDLLLDSRRIEDNPDLTFNEVNK